MNGNKKAIIAGIAIAVGGAILGTFVHGSVIVDNEHLKLTGPGLMSAIGIIVAAVGWNPSILDRIPFIGGPKQ